MVYGPTAEPIRFQWIVQTHSNTGGPRMTSVAHKTKQTSMDLREKFVEGLVGKSKVSVVKMQGVHTCVSW